MQDGDSLDAEVLYPSSGLWDALAQSDDTEVRLSCVRAYNDWIAAFCKASPERLVGLGKIPSTGVSDACEELERCVSDLGLRGVLLEAWPSGASVAGHHDDEPFWAKVNELDVPVSVHWAFGAGATTTPSTGIAPGLKPPMADAMLPMVAAGVFDRYPNVKIVYAHGDAGWALHWMEFLDSNFVRHKHLDEYALGDPDAVPSEYIRKFSWFTIRQDRSAVKNRRRFGPAHLMWASHVPLADSNWPDSRQQAMRVTDEVPPEDRDALLAGNVARLYRLPGHEKGFTDQEVGNFDTLVHF
jgi:predicted TIM-barrel fold metal-dependent hydrolase